MRTSAWTTILGLAGLAVACGDQPTEVVPEREGEAGQLAGGGTIALATASSGDGYSITTDKDDYQPGDVVHFTGAGWEPDDILDIVLTDEPQSHPPHEWSVTIGPNGTFTDDSYTVDEGDLNVTFTLVATSRSSGQSLSMTFTDGNLQQLTISPSPVRAPQTGSGSSTLTVTIGGNADPCTVTLSFLPGAGFPGGASASIGTTSVTGSTTFNTSLTINTNNVTPGTYNFSIKAARGADCQGNGDIITNSSLVVFGAPHHLAFDAQPSNTNGGGIITPAVTVQVQDVGNRLVANSTAPVTMAIQNNPGPGTLSGTLVVAAVGGIATFTDLSIDKAGTQYTLRATSAGLTQAISSNFNIIVGPAAKLLFTVQPTGANTNANLGTQPKVGVFDAGGNLRNSGAGSTASITLAVTPSTGSGTLSCSNNPVAAIAGVATFANCKINQAGNGYRLRATSGTLTLIDSDPFNITNADADAPTVNCTVPDPNPWYGANVNVPCTASDASGLANPGADASFTLSTNVGPNTETSTASTGNRSVCDVLTNCVTVGPFVFKVDRKAPVVSCGSADGAWHATDASIACTATDGGSGVSPGDESFDLTTSVAANTETANASTGTRNVTDIVGNSATAGPVPGNKVDKKAPVVSCGAADGNWHADDVSIHCTATDGGSGVAAGGASFNLTTNVAADNETANAQTGTRDVADEVGNSVTAGPIGGNQVDKKAPQFTCEAAPSAWSATDVTRDCVAADGGSGLEPASDATFSLHTTVAANTETANALTNSKELADAVDNKNTACLLGNNKVDKKNPEVTCGAADGDWHADDVSIACNGSDGGSGLADAGDASFNLVTSVAANTETANASTDSRSVADVVGHSVTAGPVTGNKVDKKTPQVTCGTADGDWHADNVSIGCTANDGGSGLKVAGDASFHLTTNVADGSETANASTNSKSVLDDVGNSSTAGPVAGNKVDRKAPAVACGAADGAWHASDVSIGCSASDGGSGLKIAGDASFTLSTTVAAGTETANASTGSRNVLDDVGNSATGGPITGNKVDKKGPTLSLTCPNSPLLLNQPNVLASWIASDGGSGVPAGFTSGSFGVSTNPAGPHTATAAAGLSHDDVGNTSTASAPCGYNVSYGFAGYTTPVDNNGVLNGANSGQAIPLKWTLKDFNGVPVTTLTSVAVTAVSLSCSQGSTADLIEEYAAGASGLINKGDGSYQFNWKTPTSYAKSCKTLRLDLGEGTTLNPVYHTALFEFRK